VEVGGGTKRGVFLRVPKKREKIIARKKCKLQSVCCSKESTDERGNVGSCKWRATQHGQVHTIGHELHGIDFFLGELG
jgi:hypothetical protein